MKQDYLNEFQLLAPIMESYAFSNESHRFKHYWSLLQHYEVYDNLSIVSESTEIYVKSLNGCQLSRLELMKCGETACVKYSNAHRNYDNDDNTFHFFIDCNNKIRGIKMVDSSNEPVIELFIGKNIVRFFNIVIPKDEFEEVMFQMSTVVKADLSWIGDLL